PGCETADRSAQRRHIGKADREIERNYGLLACIQRQTEREVADRRVITFQHEVGIDGAQREAEWIRIADLKPDANARAAKRGSRAWTKHTQFGGVAGRLVKGRGANNVLEGGGCTLG